MQGRMDIRVDSDVEWSTTQLDGQWFTTGTAFIRDESGFIELKNWKFGAIVDHEVSARDLEGLNMRSISHQQ